MVRILNWNLRAERTLTKFVKQLQYEATGEEIEEKPKPEFC